MILVGEWAVVHVNDHFGVGVGMGVGEMLYLIPKGVLCSVWLRLSHLESNWTAIGWPSQLS
jgi:hypothetical protein